MAFKGNAICTSFKRELLEGKHDFTSDIFKMALYDNTAELDADTTDYTSAGEISAAGYTPGGVALDVVVPAQGNGRAWASFGDKSILTATTARGALIYNTTAGGGSGTTNAVCVLDFGSDKTSTLRFGVEFPTADWLNALILIK